MNTRGGRGKAEQKRRDALEQVLRGGLKVMGAQVEPVSGRYVLNTIAGKLLVNPSFSQTNQLSGGGSWLCVFCKFDQPDLAAKTVYPPCNPYSGKWNFHTLADCRDEESCRAWISGVLRQIDRIVVPVRATPCASGEGS